MEIQVPHPMEPEAQARPTGVLVILSLLGEAGLQRRVRVTDMREREVLAAEPMPMEIMGWLILAQEQLRLPEAVMEEIRMPQAVHRAQANPPPCRLVEVEAVPGVEAFQTRPVAAVQLAR